MAWHGDSRRHAEAARRANSTRFKGTRFKVGQTIRYFLSNERGSVVRIYEATPKSESSYEIEWKQNKKRGWYPENTLREDKSL